MKWIKYFEHTEDEVARICEIYGIENWELQDGLVNVYGDVNLNRFFTGIGSYSGLTELPLNFGYVSGYFSCSKNKLTTLEGCPKEVGGNFHCDNNQLTTLEGCPKRVGGSFSCSYNQLTTLEGCPKEVGRNFWCNNNQLTTLEFAPLKVSGNIRWYGNPLPPEILKITDLEMRRLFLYFHHDYTLWKNGQFVKWKFEDLMDEIREYLEKHPEGIKFTN